MSTITINDLNAVSTLSNLEVKSVVGGLNVFVFNLYLGNKFILSSVNGYQGINVVCNVYVVVKYE